MAEAFVDDGLQVGHGAGFGGGDRVGGAVGADFG